MLGSPVNKGITLRITFEDFVVFPLFIVLVFLSLRICLRKIKHKMVKTKEYVCPNKNCIRCKGAESKTALIRKLDEFKQKNDLQEEPLSRIRKSFLENRTENKNLEIMEQMPTVFYLNALRPATPFHQLGTDVTSIMRKENLEKVKEELLEVLNLDYLWSHNEVETGIWKLLYFYNQGEIQKENCRQCPKTARMISQMKNFMGKSAFGNAAFSSLSPGTSIKPHYGSTNARLRCHVVLQKGLHCTLLVGNEEVVYQDNDILLFDDSFQHSVTHSNEYSGVHREGDGYDRVILMFDLWHPGVTNLEKSAIEHMFLA